MNEKMNEKMSSLLEKDRRAWQQVYDETKEFLLSKGAAPFGDNAPVLRELVVFKYRLLGGDPPPWPETYRQTGYAVLSPITVLMDYMGFSPVLTGGYWRDQDPAVFRRGGLETTVYQIIELPPYNRRPVRPMMGTFHKKAALALLSHFIGVEMYPYVTERGMLRREAIAPVVFDSIKDVVSVANRFMPAIPFADESIESKMAEGVDILAMLEEGKSFIAWLAQMETTHSVIKIPPNYSYCPEWYEPSPYAPENRHMWECAAEKAGSLPHYTMYKAH